MAIVVATALFAGVFALRMAVGEARDAISMLFVLPIALMAVARGMRAGLVAGVVGCGLTASWATVTDAELSALGWASRVIPLLLVGGLLGDASDRLRRAASERRDLEVAALRQRQAIEINDGLVQGMAATKWALEAGRSEAALETLDRTLRRGHRLVSILLRDAGMGDGGQHAALDEDVEGAPRAPKAGGDGED